jgi:hypothetical protein
LYQKRPVTSNGDQNVYQLPHLKVLKLLKPPQVSARIFLRNQNCLTPHRKMIARLLLALAGFAIGNALATFAQQNTASGSGGIL